MQWSCQIKIQFWYQHCSKNTQNPQSKWMHVPSQEAFKYCKKYTRLTKSTSTLVMICYEASLIEITHLKTRTLCQSSLSKFNMSSYFPPLTNIQNTIMPWIILEFIGQFLCTIVWFYFSDACIHLHSYIVCRGCWLAWSTLPLCRHKPLCPCTCSSH